MREEWYSKSIVEDMEMDIDMDRSIKKQRERPFQEVIS